MKQLQPIPFCGPSKSEKSPVIGAQRSVNFYPYFEKQLDVYPIMPRKWVLFPTPGKSLFTDLGGAQGRAGGLYEYKSVLYAVVDNSFYSVSASGNKTLLGTLLTSSGPVSIVDNTVQIGICDGTYGYSYTLSNGAFAQITSNFPANPTNFTYQDGYVLTASGNTVYQSNLLDLTTWGSTALVQPLTFTDSLVGIYSDGHELYIYGTKGTEIRFDAGDIPFAFEKRTDVVITQGLASVATLQRMDNTLLWLQRTGKGGGNVIRLDGYRPAIISSPAMNETIERYSTISDATSYVYQEGNSQFYVLNFPSANATWVYDASTEQFHERSSKGLGRDRANAHAYCYGKHIVNDAFSGKLYYQSQDYLDENGSEIIRSRTSPHWELDGNLIFLHELEIIIESGVGLIAGQGSAPLATLEVSRDWGHTWQSVGQCSMGLMGDYRARLSWRKLGMSKIWTFRLSISDPVKCYVREARARYTAGMK